MPGPCVLPPDMRSFKYKLCLTSSVSGLSDGRSSSYLSNYVKVPPKRNGDRTSPNNTGTNMRTSMLSGFLSLKQWKRNESQSYSGVLI